MFLYIKVFILIGWIANISQSEILNQSNVTKSRSMPVVDALISRLEAEQWVGHETCRRAALDLLQGVKNNTLWAVWVWDSIQLPVGSMYGAEVHVGNYDQCLQAPWSADKRHSSLRTQYCLTKIESRGGRQPKEFGPYDDATEYYQTPTKDSRYFTQHHLGVCVPGACAPAAVARLTQHLLALTHLPGTVHVAAGDCETAGEPRNYTTGFYVFWAIMGILSAIAVYATFNRKTVRKNLLSETITTCFCLRKNFHDLFTVTSNDIKVIHGMRFISATLIVAIHELFYQALLPNINGLQVNKILTSTVIQSLIHIEVAVDTFFALSGLLIVRGLMSRKQNNLLKFVAKRYFRLIGPYAVVIMFTVTTISFLDRGPVWKMLQHIEVPVCSKYWWKALLMLNTDLDSMCVLTTWYISCDFQLAIMATLLFYLYKKNRTLGFAAYTATAVVLTAILGLNVYRMQLGVLPFNYRSLRLKRNFTEAHYTYLKSHVRAGPYLVGMALGYIVAKYKPADYRKVIAKTWSITIATVSVIVMCAIISLGAFFRDRPYNPLEAAVVVATNRVVWALAVCSIIAVCEYGTLPKVSELLSWHAFVPLSKLSYCLYLLHPVLIQLHKYNVRGPHYWHFYNLTIQACGVLIVGCISSLLLYLIVEAPFTNLANKLFEQRYPHPEKNGTSYVLKSNGNSSLQENGKHHYFGKEKIL